MGVIAMTTTFARVDELPTETARATGRALAVRIDSSDIDDSITAQGLLAVLLGLPADPNHDSDGLFDCDAGSCGAWFWAEDGGEIESYSGPGTATRTIRVCAEHFVYDDPDIAGMYPGERLQEQLEAAAAESERSYYLNGTR